MSSFAKSAEQPFAAEGGLDFAPRREDDPYLVLDDLMAVVEALCPTWPQRNAFREGIRMLM